MKRWNLIPNHITTGRTHNDACNWPRPTPVPQRLDTTAMLRDIPDLYTHLELRLITNEPGTEPGGGRREAAHIAPVHVAILQLLDDRADRPNASAEPHVTDDGGRRGTLGELTSWTHAIHEDHPHPTPLPGNTIAEVCSWLIRHYPTWAEHMPEAAQDFTREVTRRHSAMRRALGETDPVSLRHTNLGGCGEPLEQLADGVRYECRGCHDVLTPAEMIGLAKWQADVTLREASITLGIPLITLKRWATGPDPVIHPTRDGRPRLFALRDIKAERDRRKAESRGRVS